MKKRLHVTVLMDQACIPTESPDFTGKEGSNSTEHHVVNTLRDLGHTVSILGVANEVVPLVEELTEDRPDVVFNLTEQFRDDRRLDKNVAGLLEMLDIPFTGAGSAGLMLCRNKGLCKQLLGKRMIRVPGFVVLQPGKKAAIPRYLQFPLVVKPLLEDGSEGISNASLVKDEKELRGRVGMVHERWRQAAIAEEYIEGRELYVAVLGNDRMQVLPPRELFLGNPDKGAPRLATYKVKWDEEYQKKWGIEFRHAKLDDPVVARVANRCKHACRLLQVHDFGRVDLRLTEDNHVYILEVNPNPDIAYGEEVAEAAERAGIAYPRLIDTITRLALNRHRKSKKPR